VTRCRWVRGLWRFDSF